MNHEVNIDNNKKKLKLQSCRKSDKQRKLEKTMKKLDQADKHGIELKKMKEERDKETV